MSEVLKIWILGIYAFCFHVSVELLKIGCTVGRMYTQKKRVKYDITGRNTRKASCFAGS